jgi:hypothetical protein
MSLGMPAGGAGRLLLAAVQRGWQCQSAQRGWPPGERPARPGVSRGRAVRPWLLPENSSVPQPAVLAEARCGGRRARLRARRRLPW